MTEVYGYLLNEKARYSININSNAPAKSFIRTDEQRAYHDEYKQITKSLNSNDSVINTLKIVSNWESYFSSVFNKIFDDNKFIKWHSDPKTGFNKFLAKFDLDLDFQKVVTLNKDEFDDLDFGTYITENERLNFQNHEVIKSLLELLDIDLNIVNLSNNWAEINKFLESRHTLVHSATNAIDVYNKIEIETIMEDMAKIIFEIDLKLFDKYDTEFENK